MKLVVRKQKLEELYVSDPDMGKTIEGLCLALASVRGLLIVYECEALLANVNRHIEPWVALAGVMPVEERQENHFKRKRGE
jgi:hypothetical protein